MAYIGNSPGVASQRVTSTFTATAGQTTFTPISGYTLGYCDVYYNGVKLVDGDDYTASNGVTVVLTNAAAVGDSVEIVTHFPRGLSDGYTQSEANARYAQRSNNLSDLSSASTARTNLGLSAVAASGSASDLSSGTLPVARLNTSTDYTINGLRVGRGGGDLSTNTVAGAGALSSNLYGGQNTAVGYQAGYSASGGSNTFFGNRAGYSVTSGMLNTAIGSNSMSGGAGVSGGYNVGVGPSTFTALTSGAYNIAIGTSALEANTSGVNNIAIGVNALSLNTTGGSNVAIGHQAADAITTGDLNIAIGQNSLGSGTTANRNVLVGTNAGIALTTASYNTFIGHTSGEVMTTGSKNVIIGAYNGNQGGLDIRTANNNIVLSDGDGNPRFIVSSGGNAIVGNNAGAPSTWVSGDYNGLEIGSRGNSIYGGQGGFNPIAITSNAYVSSGGTTYTKPYSAASGVFRIQGTLFTWSTSSSTSTGQITDFVTALSLEQGKSLALQGASAQSGTGITFPATQSASSDANTLDDYEEGTWTPTISPEGSAFSTLTYTYREAKYTKIGNTVFINIYLQINSVSGGSSNVNITGLPFTVAAGPGNAYPLTAWISATNWSTTYDNLVPVALYGGTTVWMTLISRNNGYGRLQATDLAAGNEWRITGFYNV